MDLFITLKKFPTNKLAKTGVRPHQPVAIFTGSIGWNDRLRQNYLFVAGDMGRIKLGLGISPRKKIITIRPLANEFMAVLPEFIFPWPGLGRAATVKKSGNAGGRADWTATLALE